MEWERFDPVLVRAETALLGLSTKFEIKHPNIERWRWDEPTITLTWRDVDHVRRNIGVRALSENEVAIEVNAWRDEDRDEGKVRVRHWQHRPIRNVKVRDLDPELPKVLQLAYQTVSQWNSADLRSETFVTGGDR